MVEEGGEMIPALDDVANFELERDRGRRWILLYPDDFETFARDVEGNLALKVDIEQAGEILSLAAQSLAALSHEDAEGQDVIRDLIAELETEIDDD
jgi:hypothetical protein